MSASGFEYKPHVDGLRAIAVLLVVLFHVGVPGIAGGFTGVDVFFVISGYLITSLLLVEARDTGRVDLLGFYARRVRRLFPALLVVVLATLGLGAVFLLPIFEEQSALAKSAIATALYLSNFYFWRFTGDYFGAPTDFEPLLHTWSLAVEEQFYFVWPLLVIAVLKLWAGPGADLRRRLGIALLALSVLSFALNLWLTHSQASAAFYLMPTRAWQFGAGGLLGLWLAGRPEIGPVPANAMAFSGLLAVIGGGLFLSERGFPGAAALVPTLGATALIAGNTLNPAGLLARLLACGPLRFIGLVSYAWYLWHWPLLAIARASALQRQDLTRDLLIGAASFGFAVLTWWLVEQPVRRYRPGPFRATRGTLATGVAISAVIAVAAVGLAQSARYQAKADPRYAAAIHAKGDVPPRRKTCNHPLLHEFRGLPSVDACTSGNAGAVRAVLWGDSHADHLSGLLEAYAARRPERGLLQRTMSSCRTYGDDPAKKSAGMVRACEDFNVAVEDELGELKAQGLTGVIFSTMWISVFRNTAVMPNTLGANTSPEYYAAAEAQLDAVITRLEAAGLRVLLVGPFHLMPHEVPQCLARHSEGDCAAPRERIEQQRAPSLAVIRRVAARHDPERVHVWDPADAVCDSAACPARRGDDVLYTDALHLTAAGARSLLQSASAQLDWVTGD
jgi:peptidoglycan/LPS O-acetylase OafA/YrhL